MYVTCQLAPMPGSAAMPSVFTAVTFPENNKCPQTSPRALQARRANAAQSICHGAPLPRLFADLSRERSPSTIFAEIRLGRDGSTDPGLNNLLGEFAHLFVSGAKRLDSGFVLFSQKTLNTSSSLTMVSAIHRA